MILHVGCANRYYEGFVNSDKVEVWKGKKRKLDLVMDLGKSWPYKDESVDGIVGMHVFQQLTWRELIVAFSEAKRVLKKGGVLRMGCPMIEIDKPLEYLLGWRNINLFSLDLLKQVLVDRIGFRRFRERGYKRSWLPILTIADNRQHRGTLYMDVVK
ncbi:hypothetical protein A2193_03415 [Candidatus Azambacteria bacterium RIFOXYA1_FULL_42_37]|nr:MAG: hypothetical protein A2193_03415 [Candidatus Azambacteria bacterium RIFOXYA1_FULL_42_37]